MRRPDEKLGIADTAAQIDDGGAMFIPMAFEIGTLAVILGLAVMFGSRPVKTDYRPLMTDAPASIAGYRLGQPFALHECARQQDAYGNTAYTLFPTESCFRYPLPKQLGKPLAAQDSVWVDQFDISMHYLDANRVMPLCVGIVDGKVEAVQVQLDPNRQAPYQGPEGPLKQLFAPFGQPRLEQAATGDQKESIYFRVAVWPRDDETVELLQYSHRTGSTRKNTPVIDTDYRALVFSERARALAENAWQTPQGLCSGG